jgi:hypothetical protein
MKLLIPALLVLTAAAGGQDHAMFGPDFARGVRDQATLRRADTALGRAPGAIPQLHTEGTLPGKGIRDISIKAKQDHPIALSLAVAWRMTGDRRYLDQAGRYLENWADTYQMSFNPIDETGFDALILATDLIEADVAPALAAKLDRFWRRMAVGYLDAMDARPMNNLTNWQSHRVKLATLAAYETGDAKLIARARAAFRAQIAANVRPDGSVFDFHERDALHYVTYDLDPLLMAALAAKAHGENWIGWTSRKGASLKAALAWLEPYATGDKTHIEFANSKIQFDRDRAAAGQAEYAPHAWDRGNAVNTYALAALCDPAYAPLRDRLVRETGREPMGWTRFYAR